MAIRDVHILIILIPFMCEYGERDFADVIKLKM